MANLNLSQFTEKTFVADADWTFVWDTAGLISKKVSRNAFLSGTTADFHLGLADDAAPVAQTLSVQSVVAGTSNTAGVNFSINGSQGTGTGAGGSLLFRTAPAGSSGTTQNALSTALAITAAGNVGIGTTAPGAPLHVQATAIAGREDILKCTVSDAGNNAFYIFNGSGTSAAFAPAFSGAIFANTTNAALTFAAQTTAASDSGTVPLMYFQSRITNSETNPNNGTFSAVSTRPLFAWANLSTTHMQMAANGNVGIGTTAPSSKLHVAGTIKPEQATLTTSATAITLDISHAGTVLTVSNASPVTVTLPTASSVGAGYNVMVIQGGAGAITFAAGSGNTLNSFGALVTSAGQHAAIGIVCTATNVYNLSGNLV